MPIGRPTKYSAAVLEASRTYLNTYESLGDVVPSAVGLAVYLQVSKATLYNWADEHRPFLDMLAEINAAQEHRLINKGLDSTFQPTITKLVLSKHGYHDTHDQNVTLKDYRVVPADETLIDADD